jgi:hypothetical protein
MLPACKRTSEFDGLNHARSVIGATFASIIFRVDAVSIRISTLSRDGVGTFNAYRDVGF